MGLKTAGAALLLRGGLLNRNLYIAAMRSATQELSSAAQNGYTTYARVQIALAGWTRANAGTAENAAAADFPQPTAAATAGCTHFALYSARTGGTLYLTQALDTAQLSGSIVRNFGFDAGDLDLGTAAGAVTGRGMRRAFESGLLSATVYAELFQRQPSAANPGSIDDRVAVAANRWTSPSGAANTARNNRIIDFGVQATDVPRPGWVGLFDAATGGNLLWEDQFDVQPSDPSLGATLSIPVNGLTVGFEVD